MSEEHFEDAQSHGISLPYRLRPNKAVDRGLFLSLLTWLSPQFNLKDYAYIGMGAEFLEDFRMIHARIGISKMTSVEMNSKIVERQEFNKPLKCIDCVTSSIEDYLEQTTILEPSVVWLDYTDAENIKSQIESFLSLCSEAPVSSILRITLNANNASLQNPEPDEKGYIRDPKNPHAALRQWRLEKLRTRLGPFFPSSLEASSMTYLEFGNAILEVLRLAVEEQFKHSQDRRFIWALSTHYADGQPMVTGTVIVADKEDSSTEEIIKSWDYHSTPQEPLKLDLPALSTKERIYLEGQVHGDNSMDYLIPKGKLKQDPVDSFRKFYRVMPHFSSVEI